MTRKHARFSAVLFCLVFAFLMCRPAPFLHPVPSEAVAADRTITSSAGLTFVHIPPGSFMMGSPEDEEGREKDEVLHRVTLTKGFFLQATEVTVGQFRQFVKETAYKTDAETKGGSMVLKDGEWKIREGYTWDHPGFDQTDDHPVTCVSYRDAEAYIAWLSKKDNTAYRLPTEAEWEYACRAGTSSRFSWGDKADCEKANFGNSWTNECKRKDPLRTVKVKSYAPNPWGLYDMHGNVWEWIRDWDAPYPGGDLTDPQGPASGVQKVVRGGSWWTYSRLCRSAARVNNDPERRFFTLGFRLAREP